MNQFIEQLRETMGKLSNGQKASIAVLFVVIVSTFIGLVLWANAETYDVVYSSNDPSKIKSATEALDEAGVPYQISDDGLSITTSKLEVGRARIISASTGAVSGMEVLGGIEMGSSPQHERWVYMNALQGELTRTINSLEEVAASRVHIVASDESPFLNRENETSASVTVRLESGRALSSAQVKGITHLLAGAVKGLDASRVVLVDESGRLLSGPSNTDGDVSSSSNLLELKQKHELQYRNKILNHLGQILGSPRHVSAAVTVEVNSEATETQKEALDPNTQVTISEKINESSSKEDTPVGIPGAESNLPEQQPAAEEGASQEKFSSATNYDYTRETKRTINKPGSVKSVSCSVSVNLLQLDELAAASNGAMSLDDYKTQIEAAVKSAIGFSETRGDQAKISFFNFADLSNQQLTDETTNWGAVMPYVIIIGVLLLLFFFLVRPLVTSLTSAVKAGGAPTPKLEDMSPQELAAYRATYGDSGGPIDRKLEQMIGNFKAIDAKELNQLVQDNEQPSAEVLRRWLRAY